MMAQEIFEQLCHDHAKAVCDCQADGQTKIKGTALTNDHRPQIINRCHGYPIKKWPFYLCTTKLKIFKSWLKIGFAPFTPNALNKGLWLFLYG